MSKPLILTDSVPPLFDQLSGGRYRRCNLADATVDQYQEVVGIFAYSHPRISGTLMDQCPNLKVISNHGVGVDHIDLQAASEREIPVGNTPGCLDATTADMSLALMLSVARNVVSGDQYARSVRFESYDPSLLLGTQVTGATIGIVGMGRIGLEVARRAVAFRMPILYHNRNRRQDAEDSVGAKYVSLSDLLSVSDFVVLTCPLSSATRGLIGEPEFQRMKSTSILINMARGPVVDTEALVTALQSGQIRAAGLDVTDPEPLPRNHPLLALSNVVITPHLGSATHETRADMMRMAIANLDFGVQEKRLPAPIAWRG